MCSPRRAANESCKFTYFSFIITDIVHVSWFLFTFVWLIFHFIFILCRFLIHYFLQKVSSSIYLYLMLKERAGKTKSCNIWVCLSMLADLPVLSVAIGSYWGQIPTKYFCFLNQLGSVVFSTQTGLKSLFVEDYFMLHINAHLECLHHLDSECGFNNMN